MTRALSWLHRRVFRKSWKVCILPRFAISCNVSKVSILRLVRNLHNSLDRVSRNEIHDDIFISIVIRSNSNVTDHVECLETQKDYSCSTRRRCRLDDMWRYQSRSSFPNFMKQKKKCFRLIYFSKWRMSRKKNSFWEMNIFEWLISSANNNRKD